MPEWQSPTHLADHFTKHGREVGARTIAEYDASARSLIDRDDVTVFSYEDWETDQRRVGMYDGESGLFTILSDDDHWILAHFRAHPVYIRGLMERD